MRRALLLIAALIGGGLSIVASAAPAAACAGSCGEVRLTIFVNGALNQAPPGGLTYGQDTTFVVGAQDVSVVCCDVPTGEIRLIDSEYQTAFAEGPLEPGNDGNSYFTAHYSGLHPNNAGIRAEYVPGNFDAEHKGIDVVVNPADTTTTLTQSATTSQYGDTVTLTAGVHDTGGIDLADGAHLPSGYVEFYDNGAFLGYTQIQADRTASLTTAATDVGSHSFIAKYAGDGDYNWSLSPAVTHEVSKAPTTTSLAQSSSSTVYGEPVSFTAAVSPPNPWGPGDPPTGAVEFQDHQGRLLGSGTLGTSGSQATFTTGTLPAGTYQLSAAYGGDPNYDGSTSSELTHVVNRASTTTSLNASPSPSDVGQEVTLTASVAAVAPGAGTPGGAVQFFDGGFAMGAPVPLSGPTARLKTTALAGGSHSFTAKYLGDANFLASTSSPVNHTVRCDRTVSGWVNGSYTAPAGVTTCFVNASVSGSINVANGARVSTVNSSTGGGFVSSGTAALILCGTRIGSVLQVTGSTGPVLVGDPRQGCAGNTVNSSATLGSNTVGLRAVGNRVMSSMYVTNNTGGPNVVGANTISGSLQCSGNDPAPVNEAQPNSASSRTGQCAGSF